MKTHFNNSISPIDFFNSKKYYFPYDLNVDDRLQCIDVNHDRNNYDNLSDYKYSLKYGVFKGDNKKFEFNISLMNMLSSSIEGVPFYEYKITNKEISWRNFFKNPDTFINNVIPLPNIITGDKFIYPAFKYEGFEEFKEETQQLQHLTNEAIIKLYSSKLKIDFHHLPFISYYRSIDFSNNAPFSWVFKKSISLGNNTKFTNHPYIRGTVTEHLFKGNNKNSLKI